MFDQGFFGNLFDFDGDGKLDSFEKTVDLCAFVQMIEDTEREEEEEEKTDDGEE